MLEGAGANFVSVSGSGNYVISAGNGDTIRQGSGPASVQAIGSNSSISGSTNAADTLFVSLGGSGNVVYANQTQAMVTITSGATSTGTANVVQGGATSAGNLTVLDTGDFAIITANQDSVVSATVSGASTRVFGGTGTLNLQASGANDSVVSGTGIENVSLIGTAAYLFGNTTGGGTLTAFVSSNNSVITPQAETTANITLTGSNSRVNAGSGALNLSIGGSADTVFAGTGTETIFTSTNPLVFGQAGGNLQFVGGAGTPTVIGGTGGTVNATVGSGGLSFSSGLNDNSTITSGVAQATIFGGSGSTVNFVGTAPGGAQFHAYAGNETLTGAGSTTNNAFYGSSISGASAVLTGGSGINTFYAGANAETMTGGGNNETFVFFKSTTFLGPANITITDFNSSDTIFMVGYDSTSSASGVLAGATGPAITSSGTGLTLTLSDKTTITFTNLTSEAPLFGKIGYFS